MELKGKTMKNNYVRCPKCNTPTILINGFTQIFYPDSEPYIEGKEEDCGYEEINLRDVVDIMGRWCPKCKGLTEIWIEECVLIKKENK